MRRIINLVLIITISFFLNISVTSAAEVLSVTANESSNGVITVEGTVENNMIAAAINVYDASGENLITMETTQINDDNTFRTTIALQAGTYVVKVADYDGGAYKTLTVSSESSASISTAKDVKTPATGDNILFYTLIGLVGAIGLISAITFFKRRVHV